MQADIHRLDIRALKQLAEIGITIRDAISNCHTLSMRLIPVRNGNHFDFRDGFVIIQVDLSDLAHSNHTNAQFIVHVLLLVGKC